MAFAYTFEKNLNTKGLNMKTNFTKTIGIIMALLISAPLVYADDLSKYFISIRSAVNGGSGTHRHYGLIIDGRYGITERFDLGLSYQKTGHQVVEMPPKLEHLAPSGEIDAKGDRQVFSFYSLFHPFGRDRTIDYYFGGSINYQLLDVDDEIGNNYNIETDTPSAFGVTLKTGANWFFHKNIGLTLDGEIGYVFHNYSAEDQISGTSEDMDSPDFIGLLSLGVSFRF